MACKKKIVTLTMQQRLNVLEDLKTLPASVVASKYNVNESTIRRIRRNSLRIKEFADKSKLQKKRQRLRRSVYEALEQRLLTWFREKRSLGDFISDALLLQQAGEIKNTMGSCSDFKVSKGWLAGFKRRHNIRLMRAYRETDEDGEEIFIENFKKLMKEEGIKEENIYNMDETSLLWRALPSKTVEGEEKSVNGYNSRKDRITVALCANASGTHKLMPLVISRYPKPCVLNRYKHRLPVIFKVQSDDWMTQALLLDWYENDFKPSVQAYQAKNFIAGKVILLLNNCVWHKVPPEAFDSKNFKIVYLPSNTTTSIQPMDQGIIAKLKVLYRHKSFRKATSNIGGLNQFHKNFTMMDSIQLLVESWAEVTDENVRNAWKKIIIEQTDIYQQAMQRHMSCITGENVTKEDVLQFMSTCEEAEKKRSLEEENGKQMKVNVIIKEEEEEEEEAEKYKEREEKIEEGQEENCKDELKYLFQRLGHYVSREMPFIQQMFQIFQNHFLGTNN